MTEAGRVCTSHEGEGSEASRHGFQRVFSFQEPVRRGGTMESSMWQEGMEGRKKRSLQEHARLHKLFVGDRLSFERERKRMIRELILSVEDEGQRKRLRALQQAWDTRMKNAGSQHNRFVLAQHFFWDHFFDGWHPTIQRAGLALKGIPDCGGPKPTLKVMKRDASLSTDL